MNFIDTADAYGPEVNELLIAEALHPYPKGLVIATKGGNTRPGPNQWVPNGRPGIPDSVCREEFEAIEAGADRFVSTVPHRYNITDRDSEEALTYCEKEKMGFIPWAPIGGSGRGSLTKSDNPLEAEAKRHSASAVQIALAWLLQKSPVMLPIPGTSSLAHLEENMKAAKLQLTPADWKTIEALAARA